MTGYKHYRGLQVEGAGPLGLLLLTYEALAQSLARARAAAETGDIEARTEYTVRAMEALMELVSSLDYEKGGKIAGNLGSLYAYMCRRILEGQGEDITATLDEVLHLAQTLREAWQELSQRQGHGTQTMASLAVAA